MHIATNMPGYPDKLKTERQWALKGYLPKPDCGGIEYWTNPYFSRYTKYYAEEEVLPASPEQLDTYWELIKKKKRKEKREREFLAKQGDEWLTRSKQWKSVLRKASRRRTVYCDNPSQIIIFAVKTTGNNPYFSIDEILHISIIDGNENVLINSYAKPCFHETWPKAAYIHGITPEMVENAPRPEELIPYVKGIVESANTIITYDSSYGLPFLAQWGIHPTAEQTVIDVQDRFAKYWGVYDEYDYLSGTGTLALDDLQYATGFFESFYGPYGYGYSYTGDVLLADVYNTLFVYKELQELK